MQVRESTIELVEEDAVVKAALRILANRISQPGTVMRDANDVKNYLTLRLTGEKREVFAVMYLNSALAVTAFEVPFAGTLTQTSVYPREILKRAMELNAYCVIFAHNHPSGSPAPSKADEHLTQTLKTGLSMVDVRVLDHIIVGGVTTYSFAENGLL